MAQNAYSAQGVTFSYSTDGSSYTALAEVTDISGPDGSTTVIDTTALADTYKSKILGIRDEGTISLDINLVPDSAGVKHLRTARTDGTLDGYKITLTDPSATELMFEAYVTEFSVSASSDEKIGASVTLEISGAVAWSNDTTT